MNELLGLSTSDHFWVPLLLFGPMIYGELIGNRMR